MTEQRICAKRDIEHFAGCLLGGAVGDALGYPVEFLSLDQIRAKYGPDGIQDLALIDGKARISDDTQMTMFTAEAILRARARFQDKGIRNVAMVIHRAYLRWLHTQGRRERTPFAWGRPDKPDDGWLIGLAALHASRSPGATCLTALESGEMGQIDRPLNNSKGCGGVMRVAPIGLYWTGRQAFDLGCQAAAITHGHPSSYLAGGTFAAIISGIIEGMSLQSAIVDALDLLRTRHGWHECGQSVERAVELAASAAPAAETVEQLGEGFVAEEALAIAAYCALAAGDDFARGVRLAVNHSGDSDSTGSMTGNILGACLGRRAIPYRWLQAVELGKEIENLADDLLLGWCDSEAWHERYPPN
jgi:ADP-ribosylglycohydrolase